MNPNIDVMNHGFNIWLIAILQPDFILWDQDQKWEIHHWLYVHSSCLVCWGFLEDCRQLGSSSFWNLVRLPYFHLKKLSLNGWIGQGRYGRPTGSRTGARAPQSWTTNSTLWSQGRVCWSTMDPLCGYVLQPTCLEMAYQYNWDKISFRENYFLRPHLPYPMRFEGAGNI